ncbi:hypothetical protein DFH08DRAFT_816615 [Mycena albidolilacea]|uniref:Uncharacterized protein n=1 Tax=Mycena albidolilacea TaxID=1033008 RepID=A0AAD7EJ45_9AGAR|nr:hypothetical protein DFH08DRAFT_816615 [Mycena albidolilacea]
MRDDFEREIRRQKHRASRHCHTQVHMRQFLTQWPKSPATEEFNSYAYFTCRTRDRAFGSSGGNYGWKAGRSLRAPLRPGQIGNLDFNTSWYSSVLVEKETEGDRVEGAPRKPRST